MMRLWPRNMTGQVMMAVAIALLLVQGIGAVLVFKAQNERREASIVNAAAFRLAVEAKGGPRGWHNGERRDRPERPHGRFRILHVAQAPIRTSEPRDANAEAMLARMLADQDIRTSEVAVTYRDLQDDPIAMQRVARRAAFYGPPGAEFEGDVMVAAIRVAGSSEWLVTRVWNPGGMRELIPPLILQTAIIYIVLVTVVWLVMRRITRPLAKLTGRVEHFAQTRQDEGRIEPEGPDDIRRLIEAHNAMESRIISLLDEKDVMLGAIGHDLKTPLAALRVRIESVSDDTERRKMAGTIEDIARSLDDILSLARVGRPSDLPERSELSALVASIVEEYEDMGEPVELGETQRVVLETRPTWLRRALRNLIDNALRYGEAANVSLARDEGRVRIMVEDNGPGIAEDAIARMMEPFTRGDPSRNSATGGAGLGLALARAIAEQHGGKLKLSNRAEGGLRAELSLPC